VSDNQVDAGAENAALQKGQARIARSVEVFHDVPATTISWDGNWSSIDVSNVCRGQKIKMALARTRPASTGQSIAEIQVIDGGRGFVAQNSVIKMGPTSFIARALPPTALREENWPGQLQCVIE